MGTNHKTDSIVGFPIRSDGGLEELSQLLTFTGTVGPHRLEQTSVKPHQCIFDPSGRYVIIPTKGSDEIFSILFENGRLVESSLRRTQGRESAGCRHIVFHPSGNFAYVINELDSTITVYDYSVESGLEPKQLISSVAETFVKNSRGAAIIVNKAGTHLYASNRGEDSIGIFSINQSSGMIKYQATVPTHGRTPRSIAFSPDEKYFYVTNEDSDSITQFQVHADGNLTYTDFELKVKSPVCMIFL